MSSTDLLAIHGGIPVRDTYLPYGKQMIDGEDIQTVMNVLQSNYLTTGPSIEAFEEKVAQYVGAKYAVAFSSGTAALHAACFAAGIHTGDEVITTPITFAASANCILYQGGKPVFADIDYNTYNIDPLSIEKLITKNTKAIIPVDFTGQPVDLDKVSDIAKRHNLIVIEDAAHSFGAAYKGRKIGALSDMTMFSFHPVKHITTGEGGIITTNNEEYYRKLAQFRSHGITKDPSHMAKNDEPWYYEMQFLGYNYRMTDIQAALGLSQLNKTEYFLARRRQFASIYNEAFKDIEEIAIPFHLPDCHSSWHLYILRLNLDRLRVGRKEIYQALLQENIGVNVHYIPVYLQPYYQELGYNKSLCPQAEKLYEEIITLPLFPGMNEKDVEDVVKAAQKVVKYYGK
ncbi:UDP-4-amino-4,6-dideoxy-N-acetyl-beta-L-altrosamine transaminase [Aneurinibacillus sp. Ricciae_BoGa-3]|uniref:UDP-4-amino-4, 6-dideoxy-N-acetyl-beta-L-altrosamine transaminase n=1 Tax=Aneurinibacillus sp. Ricciae_BoGa-3 TaxID=3022697 RepID=UPI002341457B|nr:UDP-4-amino-4,6-dideoxy-N-acetyl-beta-L-altrosamine transaminase [Aneurinibacillus sp. Ricciae_BoGa-3]WCK54188.1 UDP-4-amino-4,6-dideoxy-N-acetyl-beta-L-altrosamine transaminase [Aneurinibacillus sp. Ricciae_BoGa-3]